MMPVYHKFPMPIRVRHKLLNAEGVARGYIAGSSEEYTHIVVDWYKAAMILNDRPYLHNLIFIVPASTRRIA